ncbi:MAG TPA: hypothetical protein VMF09_05530 [Solirubrobacteraceae bacterium]|nr:hypothetical protein [Solirubrobacteraceae bacterium]
MDRLKEPSKGQPGYVVKCKSSILTVEDECKAKEAADDERVTVENLEGASGEPPTVTVAFPEERNARRNGRTARSVAPKAA